MADAAPPTPVKTMRVEVVHCPKPGTAHSMWLTLPCGALVADAVAGSGLAVEGGTQDALPVGIWGRISKPETPLRDGDRVEIYRPLTIDPKEARRQREHRQQQQAAPATRKRLKAPAGTPSR